MALGPAGAAGACPLPLLTLDLRMSRSEPQLLQLSHHLEGHFGEGGTSMDVPVFASPTPLRAPKGGRSSRRKRDIVEALPSQEHLARSRLERLDLWQEVRGVRGFEDERFRSSLTRAHPPSAAMQSPLGAPPPGLSRRPTPGALSPPRTSASRLPTAAGGAQGSEEAPKKRPGILMMEIPQDPTTFPNEHIARHAAIGNAIEAQQHRLQASRSESALLKLRGADADFTPPQFKWDRLPTANSLGISEQQSQYFPRSLDRNREIGNVKDPKSLRPYDDWYLYRETLWKQKHTLKS